jgi:hypothetical protein
LTIRQPSVARAWTSSIGFVASTRERTRIVSPIATGRLNVADSNPRRATTRSGSNATNPTA